jgi:hypothetical protein
MISDLSKLTAAIDAVTDPPVNVNFTALENRLRNLSSADIGKLRETIESGEKAELQLDGQVVSIRLRSPNGRAR